MNIIAHSMGGLDSRVIISRLGYEDKVASLCMVGTPNRGSYIADLVTSFFDTVSDKPRNALDEEQIAEIAKIMGTMFVSANENKLLLEDTLDAVHDLTQFFLKEEFNPITPDSPKVYYQSWAARTGRLVEPGHKDVVNGFLNMTYGILKDQDGDNDGMVAIESAKWGNFRGILEADHLDIVGLFLTEPTKYFDHKKFYLDMALELGEGGF